MSVNSLNNQQMNDHFARWRPPVSLFMAKVVAIERNGWSRSTETGGRHRAKQVVAMVRNTQRRGARREFARARGKRLWRRAAPVARFPRVAAPQGMASCPDDRSKRRLEGVAVLRQRDRGRPHSSWCAPANSLDVYRFSQGMRGALIWRTPSQRTLGFAGNADDTGYRGHTDPRPPP